jgi:hypothetical protein
VTVSGGDTGSTPVHADAGSNDGGGSESSRSSSVSAHDALPAPDPPAHDVTVAGFWKEAAIRNNIAAGG